MTKPENQDATTASSPFSRPRRLTAVVALSLGAGTLVYGSVLAFPAAADSGGSQTTAATSCTTSTSSAAPSASPGKTDTGTATATPTATDSSTDSPTASATPTGTASASGSASASPSASDSASEPAAGPTPTDCATRPGSGTGPVSSPSPASPSASRSHTATPSATPTVKKSATPTPTATIPGSGSGNGGPGSPGDGGDGADGHVLPNIPFDAVQPTGQYFAYSAQPPGNAAYQLPYKTITRAQIIARAQLWVQAQVPYSQVEWYKNANGTYRQDCSGFVSMAWDLNQNVDFWTGNLNLVSHTIAAAELLPGDILLSDVHTILFAGWANTQHTEFDYYEEAHPGTVARYVVDAPLSAFLDNGFAPFRYDGIVGSSALPANPADGDLYATLAQKASEIHPPGVMAGQPGGLGQSASPATTLSAQVASDDVVSSEGARSEGVVLGAGGAFLVGAGLLMRRPSIPLRGRRRKR